MERLDPWLSDGRWRVDHLVRYEWASQFVAGKRVLDAACGCGYGANLLCSAGAAAVVGIDRSAQTIAEAEARYGRNGLRFVCRDLLELTSEDFAPFDLIVSFETLEHLGDPNRAVETFGTLLTPSGLFVCSVPSERYKGNGNTFHLTEFDRNSFETLLKAVFPNVQLLQQRFLIGSEIVSETYEAVLELRPCSRVSRVDQPDLHWVADCYIAVCGWGERQRVTERSVVSASAWRADEDEVRQIQRKIQEDARISFERVRQDALAAEQDARRWREESGRLGAEWEELHSVNAELRETLNRMNKELQASGAECVRLYHELSARDQLAEQQVESASRLNSEVQKWCSEATRLSTAWIEHERIISECRAGLTATHAEAVSWQAEAARLSDAWKEQERVVVELRAAVDCARSDAQVWQSEATKITKAWAESERILSELRTSLSTAQADAEAWKAEADRLASEWEKQRASTAALQAELAQLQQGNPRS